MVGSYATEPEDHVPALSVRLTPDNWPSLISPNTMFSPTIPEKCWHIQLTSVFLGFMV